MNEIGLKNYISWWDVDAGEWVVFLGIVLKDLTGMGYLGAVDLVISTFYYIL